MPGDIVVVTGGAQGIGLATTKHLVAAGRQVAIVDANADAAQRAAHELRSAGGEVYTFTLDVRDPNRTREIAEEIEARLGPVAALITCAGTTRTEPAETMSFESWKDIIDINLTGTFLSCQAFAKAMLKRASGSIVTISSVTGTGGMSGRVNYAASKFGVIGLTKTLAIEWGNRGVRVNSVAPGAINTTLFAKVPTSFRDGVILDRTPMKRPAEVDEVARVILFLLSDSASFVNGAVLTVDGGFSAGFATHNSGADLAV